MALQDILSAIIAESDDTIARERQENQMLLTQLREQSERNIARKRQQLAVQREEKKQQMFAKGETHAEMLKRNATLEGKQTQLDRTYGDVLNTLSELPAEKVELLLRACLKSITHKGVIHPCKKHADLLKKLAPSEQFSMGEPVNCKGGFRFVSPKYEMDCTFEELVHLLRRKTELSTAHKLFA